jgi:hypothetical protein
MCIGFSDFFNKQLTHGQTIIWWRGGLKPSMTAGTTMANCDHFSIWFVFSKGVVKKGALSVLL